MALSISATAIKYWFQYRCERKLVYESLDKKERSSIPIFEKLDEAQWARFGKEYERDVIEALCRAEPEKVLIPPQGEDCLSEFFSLAFCERKKKETYAHQMIIQPGEVLKEHLKLPEGVRLNRGKPDLVRVSNEESEPVFTIIDIKATMIATIFHKAQTAYYGLMLESLLAERGLPGRVADEAMIWHQSPPGENALWAPTSFSLRSYKELVMAFFHRDVPGIAQKQVSRRKDNTNFHVYFKCEQCKYLPHCSKSFKLEERAQWDLSAVHGLSQSSKATLLNNMNVCNVGELAEIKDLQNRRDAAGWALKSRAELLSIRSRALIDDRVYRVPNRFSWMMPPMVHVGIHLVIDSDPVDGNLAALGCLVTRESGNQEMIRVIAHRGDELEAVLAVLNMVVDTLRQVDLANRENNAGQIAHIYLYEPSEGTDLQKAFSRYLKNEYVIQGLLELIRIFPPEEVVPEPEYRGAQHLPATPVRSVLEQLYAIPVRVSYDLRQVSTALLRAGLAYQPEESFQRPFSSRLSIDKIRGLRGQKGMSHKADIERDISKRLHVLKETRRWIERDNALAETPFLRLRKRPFLFQDTFHPFHASDLDILLAQEILVNRAGLLKNLISLAQPVQERRNRFRCFANLELISSKKNRQGYSLVFQIPPESRDAELSSQSFGLILTNNDPDILLDPSQWPGYRVNIAPPNNACDEKQLLVFISRQNFEAPAFKKMCENTADNGWFIDEIFVDYNTAKTAAFLAYLADEGAT